MSKRLEMEVWSLDNCAGCGLCVAECPTGSITMREQLQGQV